MNISGIALTGLNNAQTAFNSAASRLLNTSGDTVDLSTEATNVVASKNHFEANIDVLKAADNLQKSTLSLLA